MKDIRQELFNHLSSEHDLILLETELDAVIHIVREGLNNSAQAEALSVGNNEQAKEFFKELEIKQVNIPTDIDKHLWDLL